MFARTVLSLFAAALVARAEPVLGPTDRVLVLAPHPDDETIGCGGVIQQALRTGAQVRVVFLTNGDNNEWSFLLYRGHPVVEPSAVESMGLLRQREALEAAATLGLAATNLVFLGYPDYGTMKIWTDHWDEAAPYRAMLTRATNIPYADAFRPGAAHKGEEVVRDLRDIIGRFRPTALLLPHAADYNADHRALFLFARVALWDLEGDVAPARYPYLVHYPRWPEPRGLHTGMELAGPAALEGGTRWVRWPLEPQEREVKLAALKKHASQWNYSATYLESFVRANELFGDFAPGAADDGEAGGAMDELSDEERAHFVGIERRTIRVEGPALVVSLQFSRPLADGVRATVFAFGYRRDTPFGKMPKIRAETKMLSHEILDQDRPVKDSGVEVKRTARGVEVRIPLVAMGSPDKILTSARTYLEAVPLDSSSWRELDAR